jgi:hypothetical protein
MPYLNDPRRTVTINLHPNEYAALAEDALTAGYQTPGTYAKALVRARGDAPEPILDRRSAERVLSCSRQASRFRPRGGRVAGRRRGVGRPSSGRWSRR